MGGLKNQFVGCNVGIYTVICQKSLLKPACLTAAGSGLYRRKTDSYRN
jgi:hypothetical protein